MLGTILMKGYKAAELNTEDQVKDEVPIYSVAYVDEIEDTGGDKAGKTVEKVYYSALVKAMPKSVDSSEPEKLDQYLHILTLCDHGMFHFPGQLWKKPKNENLLRRFLKKHGVRKPTILGLREHIFTGSVSSLAWFMSNQENSFVNHRPKVAGQPLK
ncbi:UNVERIFIED_CONTAM: Callose synthase 1 [Sesamum angustifolium]|uniref:Callose synthase 1 n=1 Tax=Sesamum angustifolium TaxID=2727405 RepID=A0AAW2RIP3_9LAMI